MTSTRSIITGISIDIFHKCGQVVEVNNIFTLLNSLVWDNIQGNDKVEKRTKAKSDNDMM